MADDGTTRTPGSAWDAEPDYLSATWEPTKDPCTLELGAGWRIPTNTEWAAADANGSWGNYTDTYNSVLKLHAAGYLDGSNGSLSDRGTTGRYWSSTQEVDDYGYYLYFRSDDSYMFSEYKTIGFSVRCLRD